MQFIPKLMLTVVFLLIAFTWLSSCKKDDDPDPRDLQIKQLTATWNVSHVENDDENVTAQFSGFTLAISGFNYQTTNGANPWPSGGTYSFKGNDLNTIIRSDGTEISIVELTANTLVLSFNYNSLSNGRTSGITGDFIFSLTK